MSLYYSMTSSYLLYIAESFPEDLLLGLINRPYHISKGS